jgi:Mn2+/Fe2+ NRAMP family transporter
MKVPTRFGRFWNDYGPGVAVAATGVGAGDLVAASVAGAMYGTPILWVAVAGALIKYCLNEGIARWQLATETTLLTGWRRHLHRLVSYYFLFYLIVWSFVVAAALIAACGLAAHAIVPALSVAAWGIIHSIAGVLLVLLGHYLWFERLMKLFTALMFVTVVASAFLVKPDVATLVASVIHPTLPEGSARFLLSVMGGVGGSVTLLSYGYWIGERGWKGKEFHRHTQRDLGVAYTLTGLFGVALIIIAAEVNPLIVTGDRMVLEVALKIEQVSGAAGKWIFLVGFWGAVFTSLFGVWQSVPYYFVDFVLAASPRSSSTSRGLLQPLPQSSSLLSSTQLYRIFLIYLAFPPMALLLFGKPVWVIILYSITGAFFMPFLALTLLWMNTRSEWVGELRNSWWNNTLLVLSLLLFGYLCFVELSALK